MNIVEPTPLDMLLPEAVALTGIGPKTLRRAVQVGELPRRYALGPRGPQLVFDRPTVEEWASRRNTRGQRRAAFSGAPAGSGVPISAEALVQLEHALARSQDSITQAMEALHRQQQLLQQLISSVAARAGREDAATVAGNEDAATLVGNEDTATLVGGAGGDAARR